MNSKCPDILLATVNARYYHTSFGLRCLKANMGPLRDRTKIAEFEGQVSPEWVAAELTRHNPKIVGLGVYIWNAEIITALIPLLRQQLPEARIIVGGPEVSYTPATHPVAQAADYVVCGEADLAFADLCRRILDGQAPGSKKIFAEPPPLNKLHLPYTLYTEEDIAHRNIYIEAARGCPFSCQYCVSGRDDGVRHFDIQPWFAEIERLLQRGGRKFLLVDRSFNIDPEFYLPILDFFYRNRKPGMELHLELVPMLFPDAFKSALKRFPPGMLRLEVGVQTLNEEVNRRIGRRQKSRTTLQNLQFIVDHTHCHLHIDLIAGLPGESLQSLAASFDRLLRIGADEVQFGILKKLPGTAIGKHDKDWGMAYSDHPPYPIIENKLIDSQTMEQLKRFARYWRMIATSGRFPGFTDDIIFDSPSPFFRFMDISDYLYSEFERPNRIALVNLAESLFKYLQDRQDFTPQQAAQIIAADYCAGGLRRLPPFLKQQAHC